MNILKKYFNAFLSAVFFISFSVHPLSKNCLCILLENSLNDLQVLVNFRNFNLFYNGIPPIIATLILQNINDIEITSIIITSLYFILFIITCPLLKESMRYCYEYWDLKQLTNIIYDNFNLDKINFNCINNENDLDKEIDYKKNTTSLGRYKRKNSFYNEIIEQIKSLTRKIKRNIFFVIKKQDVLMNPLIIPASLGANRLLKKSKYLLISVFVLTYLLIFSIEREMTKVPFYRENDLIIGIHDNVILNSKFFILILINYLSNQFYYFFYRITCFKIVIIVSSIIVTISCIIYHFVTFISKETPIDLIQYNFGMLDIYRRDNANSSITTLIFIIHFAMDGIECYYHLLIIIISRTLYRGTLFGIHDVIFLFSFALSEGFHSSINRPFFFLGIVNLLCLLTFMFVDEFQNIPYLINDLKIHN